MAGAPAWRRLARRGDGGTRGGLPKFGFMGIPLVLVLLGEKSVGIVMSTMLVDLVVTTSLCIGLSQWGTAGDGGALRAAGGALRGVLRNPLSWAILLGALASAVGLSLWQPAMQTITLLGDAASPVALFTIGAVLARSQMLDKGNRPQPASVGGDIGWIVGIKLFVHPLLILGGGALALQVGVLSAAALVPLILTAALPSASNVSLPAERFHADNGRIARIILWSTSAAFVTFSVIAGMLVK